MWIAFPDWPQQRLERVAEQHASEIAAAYGRDSEAPVDRLVVNLLRHEFTAYDQAPTQEAHRIACDAIAARFPWLAEECRRQVRARAADERLVQEGVQMMEAAANEGKRFRAERVAESKAVIGRLKPGMQVRAKVAGRLRNATILKVGRSRVTIEFSIKSGARREALLYARDLDAEPEGKPTPPPTPPKPGEDRLVYRLQKRRKAEQAEKARQT